MAYAWGVIGCDWDGTIGVVAAAVLGGIGTILLGAGLHALGGMFIIGCVPAATALKWGPEIVVYSSHGTDGSNGGGAAKSVDPTIRGSVSKRCCQHSEPACLPGTNDDMGLPGKEVAWNPDASWLASKGMGW